MEKYISSKNMKIAVREKGAELFSVVIDNEEFIWNKKEVWAKSSPILFPFVGVLKDSMFKVENKSYNLDTRHGFIRDMKFDELKEEGNKLICKISSNEETLEKYPYRFTFTVIYEILEENKLKMMFKVENRDTKDMYFSLGAHPAFLLPKNYEDYYIKLDKKQKLYKYELEDAKYLGDNKLFFADTDRIDIRDENFKDDAIIFDGSVTNKSVICHKNDSRKIIVEHYNFPYIAYWRPEKANFVCIEPWYGVSDRKAHNNNIEEKVGIQKLNSGKTFEASIIFSFEK